MNSYGKFTISILFTVVLSTGFLSIANVQRAHAFPIDFGDLPGFGDDQGLDFFQDHKGDKGDTRATGHQVLDILKDLKDGKGDTGAQGPAGPQGEQGPKGDKG